MWKAYFEQSPILILLSIIKVQVINFAYIFGTTFLSKKVKINWQAKSILEQKKAYNYNQSEDE